MTKLSFNLSSIYLVFIIFMCVLEVNAQSCPAPTNLSKVFDSKGTSITTQWAPVSGATGYNYKIYVNQTLFATHSGAATSYITSLPSNTYHVAMSVRATCGINVLSTKETTGIWVTQGDINADTICIGIGGGGYAALDQHEFYDKSTMQYSVLTTNAVLNSKLCSSGPKGSKVFAEQKMTLSPNPFTNITTLNLQLKEATQVTLKLFDSKGKQYESGYIDQAMEAGAYNLPINGLDLPVGVYFARLTINGETTVYKLMKIE